MKVRGVKLDLTVDNPFGGGSYATHRVVDMQREIRNLGGSLEGIDTYEALAKKWCYLRCFGLIRVEVQEVNK